ncbi:MAG TPA: hypothetical protein VIK01_05400 [Polyangiaceae bacterium]
MSVAQNEAAARADEQAAQAKLCNGPADAADSGPCWAAQSPETQREVADLRRKANEHRNAAAVRKAEEEACSGVSEADRVQSPFSHHDDIESVQPLEERLPQGGVQEAGAVVVFRKVPRLSAGVFQKILDCHLARDAAFGFDARELEYCPLNVNPLGFRHLKATVTERSEAFEVKIYAEDAELARKVLARAQSLVGPQRCLQTPVLNET